MGLKSPLLWKLFGINVVVVAVVIAVVWQLFDNSAAAYFRQLMAQFDISPTMAHAMFLQTVHRYLLLACLGAAPLAAILSLLMTRRLLRPLRRMAEVTERVASGDFHERVRCGARDEIGSVARSFNRMTESLQRLEEARMTRVIDLAHELRSPLTNVRGYLEAVRDGVIPASPETIDSLHEETVRLARLVEDLLQLANADAARITLRRRATELEPFLRQILQIFRARFAAKSISVDVDVAGGVVVAIDPDKMAQVVRNLLQNAWQYAPEGGRVRVRAERSHGAVRVSFWNSGEPIPDDDVPRIFERAYRGRHGGANDDGAGIGLAIARELAEAHGGGIDVENLASGPRFVVDIPVTAPALHDR